jgi:hypothetical protein
MEELNDFEKARILLKYQGEGNRLFSLMDYGVPSRLYKKFREEFDEVYQYQAKLNALEAMIEEFLDTEEVQQVLDDDKNKKIDINDFAVWIEHNRYISRSFPDLPKPNPETNWVWNSVSFG